MGREEATNRSILRPDTSGLSRWAWLPIPLFLAATAVLWATDQGASHESVGLAIALNIVFSVLASFLVAYLIGRSFLIRGVPGLLMLGCGVVVWGLAGVMGLLGKVLGAPPVTIHNVCVFLSAVCQLVGAVLLLRSRPAIRNPGLWLAVAYSLSLVAVAFISLWTLAGRMPVFFIQGQGGTPLRQVVLGASVAMFLLTADLLRTEKRVSPSQFTHWYALALGLIATGMLGVMIQSSSGSLLGWTGRSAQFLSGVYFVVAALAAVRESGSWQISLEEALRESESVLRAFFDSPGMLRGIMEIADGDLRYVSAGKATAAAYGLSPDAVCGKSLSELGVPPEVVREYRDRAEEAVRTGQAVSFEMFRQFVTGDRWLLVTASSLDAGLSGRSRIAFVMLDITERKQAEEALRESEARFKLALRNSPVNVAIQDRDFVYQWAYNQKTRTPDEIIGKTDADLFAPEDLEWIRDVKRKVIETGEEQHTAHWLTSNGQRVFLDLHYEPVRNADGEIVGIGVAAVNLSEQELAKQALRESEERYRNLVRFAPAAIYEMDLRGTTFLSVNDVMCDILGYTREELLSMKPGDLLHPESRSLFQERLRKKLAGESVDETVEYRIRRKDGEWISAVVNVGAFSYTDQHHPRVVVIAHDVTERKQAEAEHHRLAQQRQIALDAASLGWWHYDPVTRIAAYDQRYREIFDVLGSERPNEEILARLHPDDLPGVWAKVEVALNPDHPESYSAEYRVFHDDASIHWVEAHGMAIFEGEGETRRATSMVGTVQDITERKKAHEAVRTTSQRFYTVLSSMQTGLLLVTDEGRVEFANQALCDFFDLSDSPEDLVGLTSPEILSMIRDAYVNPDAALARIREIVELGQPVTGEEVPMLSGRKLLRDFIPVRVNGESYGRLWYHTDITLRKQAEEALREQFVTLQRALLPAKPTIGPGYELDSAYIPAYAGEEIGGDFYDVFETEDGRVCVLIGDVSGKGIEAASLGAITRSTLRAFAYELSSCCRALTHTNSLLTKQQVAQGHFVTVFLAILDLPSGRICYSRAGHPAPAVLRADGSVEFLNLGDLPLGVHPAHDYSQGEANLDHGDEIVLYTDGISEARHGAQLFGPDGIESVLRQHVGADPAEVCEKLLDAARDFAQGSFRDDAALIVIQRAR